MAEQHLEKTMSELLSQREQVAAKATAEIARIDAAVEAIRRLMSPNGAAPKAAESEVSEILGAGERLPRHLGGVVNPGDFFGSSQAEAAREYLRRTARAATLDDIFAALQKGGARLQGKNPRKNLYISLSRRKDVFALVAPYTFGLWEFYPGAKERGGEGRISAQLREVMQGGKGHRIAEVIGLLEQKYGRKFARSTVAMTLRRGNDFRKVRRGLYKIVGD